MMVMVLCEFSGVVRDAFTGRGHTAISCDLLNTERNGKHLQMDCRDERLGADFWRSFDLLIAHPPCTYLAVSGARWFASRKKEQDDALNFVRWIMNLPIPCIAIENPVSVISSRIRKPDQIVHPWWFGTPETKATCWWLKGLPLLKPTDVTDGRNPRVHYESPGPDRWKRRSRTDPNMARAMAEQWA